MESLAFNIAERVLTRLASHTYQQICLAWGVRDELNKLQETLQTITIVLLDAEEKQTENPLLSIWLGKLKEVCYDADQVLDDFEFQKLQMQVLNRGSIRRKARGKVCNFLSRSNPLVFHCKMGHRIKEIRKRLDEITVEKNNFSLSERVGEWHGVHMQRETGSSVLVSDVFGRDDDKKKLITHLLKNTGHGDVNLSLISIIGLGGLGKTTLAQLVCNDETVKKQFNLSMWVCVSDDFDHETLVRKILKSATNQNCEDVSLDGLEIKLKNVLRDKKFLLVLDDVWDKKPQGITKNKWIRLESLLKVGANGSKLIVTTRSESVASLMGSTHMHRLEGLSPEDCMSLFIKRAFRKGEEKQYSHLLDIANSIVKKCGGVPLAVTTVGSLLSLKRDRNDWLKVRDNAIWTLEQQNDDILPALKLSYNALPPYLKPCFVFCSLFPKDYQFGSPILIGQWMAHGFLETSNGNQGHDEIGLDYIRQLCSRSLFQLEDDWYSIVTFKMHDLVHDLAISEAQVEMSSVNFRPNKAFERVRHVSLSEKDFSQEEQLVPEFLLQSDKLQTILFPTLNGVTNESFLKTCISRFKYLRVLDLNHSTLEVLPSSIGNLIHLRYLDLSHNRRIEKLPDSICKLLNLQALIVLDCQKLKELPRDIGNLVNLIRLGLTTQQTYLPEGIRHLSSLQFLGVKECVNLKSLGEGIQYLTNLRQLVILKCESLESMPPNMERLTALDTLSISTCEKLDLMESGQGIRDLRVFVIVDQSLEVLPGWLQDSANTLEMMSIWNCDDLTVLPEWLQNFRLLQKLKIGSCRKLSSLPEGMRHLTALRELEIRGCPELSRRCKREEGEDWSNISHVPSILFDGEQIASIDDLIKISKGGSKNMRSLKLHWSEIMLCCLGLGRSRDIGI